MTHYIGERIWENHGEKISETNWNIQPGSAVRRIRGILDIWSRAMAAMDSLGSWYGWCLMTRAVWRWIDCVDWCGWTGAGNLIPYVINLYDHDGPWRQGHDCRDEIICYLRTFGPIYKSSWVVWGMLHAPQKASSTDQPRFSDMIPPPVKPPKRWWLPESTSPFLHVASYMPLGRRTWNVPRWGQRAWQTRCLAQIGRGVHCQVRYNKWGLEDVSLNPKRAGCSPLVPVDRRWWGDLDSDEEEDFVQFDQRRFRWPSLCFRGGFKVLSAKHRGFYQQVHGLGLC